MKEFLLQQCHRQALDLGENDDRISDVENTEVSFQIVGKAWVSDLMCEILSVILFAFVVT